MSILITIYLATVVLAFVLGVVDFKGDFGFVDVRDVCFITFVSLIPIGNIGIILVASSGIIGREFKEFFSKVLW